MLKSLLKRLSGSPKVVIDENLPLGVRTSIDNYVRGTSLPSLSAAAQRAFAVATNPASEPEDFVEVVESDEALASRVMRIANSVYFSRGVQIKHLEDAVVTIGIQELRGLLNASTVSQLFPLKHNLRESFWRNALITATLAKHFAPRFGVDDGDFCFLCGLMHDIGKLFLLRNSTSVYEEVCRSALSGGRPFEAVEVDHFPFTHMEVGQYIGLQWNFSPDLIRAIRFHHEKPEVLRGGGNSYDTTLLIQACDSVGHVIGSAFREEATPFKELNRQRLQSVLEHTPASVAFLEPMIEEAKEVLEREQDGMLSWVQ